MPFFKNIPTAVCLFFAFLITPGFSNAYAVPLIKVTDDHSSLSIGSYSEEYLDRDSVSTLNSIILKQFESTKGGTLNYNPKIKSVWLRFKAANFSSSPSIFLNVTFSNIQFITIYKKVGNNYSLIGKGGNGLALKQTFLGSPDPVFNLNLNYSEQGEYLIHIKSKHPIIFPANVTTYNALADFTIFQTSIISIYLGILIIMFLYNVFLYFSTRDKNYLYYVVYIFFLTFAQFTAAGYSYKFFWSDYPAINDYAVIWTSSFATITGIIFSMIFLNTSKFLPKAHIILKAFIGVYIAGIILSILNLAEYSYYILNYNGLVSVVTILIVSINLAKKGFRPAVFYLIAWLTLLLSFIVLKFINLNWLPYNTFTRYAFYIGSAVEVALLSLALADRINVLKREKETSQAEALRISLENEQLVREQNIVLESKVAERTEELQKANTQIISAYKNLENTQIQLVEAEKMASLGQLTAGIAHEINNPINFVKSNIKPLQLDFKDLISVVDEYEKLHTLPNGEIASQLKDIEALKDDIDLEFVKSEVISLMKGIENGAERTAEIVRGLRTFSRLDESVLKTVDIHEGIDSTLILLRSNIPDNVKVIKQYNANGNIECFPGKLNQVFMNILSNAIHAIKQKAEKNNSEQIIISTNQVSTNEIQIRIKDSGSGMPEEVKQKIFDPFFTTKDVGEGTGLGLAIVFKIVQEHAGKIEVHSEIGKGSEFILTLNHSIPGKAAT